MTIGEQIRKYRRSKNMTMIEMAKQLGISQSSISFYETNQRTPDSFTLEKISQLLDCTFSDVKNDKHKKGKPKLEFSVVGFNVTLDLDEEINEFNSKEIQDLLYNEVSSVLKKVKTKILTERIFKLNEEQRKLEKAICQFAEVEECLIS